MKRLVILTIIFLVLTGCASKSATNTYKVQRVVDGDTFVIMMNGKEDKVRLIGVDTPESVKPNSSVERYGKEASKFTRNAIEGRAVMLEFDVQQRDKYGRLLAYVYLEDGSMFNEVLIAQGYAKLMSIPPNVKYADRFKDLQAHARKSRKGLWQ